MAKARFDIDGQIVRYTEGFAAKDKQNHPVADSLRGFPLDNWSSTSLSGQTNDSWNREHVVPDLFSKFK